MAKKIPAAKIAKAKSQAGTPTTGNGRTGGQKPKMSETNLPGKTGFIAGLFTRRSQPGKHQGN